ncbi:MAG: hypothetical protein ACRDT0_08845 [Pseudonocardiaceae bacterium]
MGEQERDELRTVAGLLLDEVDSAEPDDDRHRRLGALPSVRNSAQVLGKALLAALGMGSFSRESPAGEQADGPEQDGLAHYVI